MKPRERAGRKEPLVTVETKHCIHGGFQVEFEEDVKMTFSFGLSGINANRTNTRWQVITALNPNKNRIRRPNHQADFLFPSPSFLQPFCPSIHPSISITLHQTAHTQTQKKRQRIGIGDALDIRRNLWELVWSLLIINFQNMLFASIRGNTD